MQEIAWVRGFCVQNPKFTLFLITKNTHPHHQKWNLSGILELRLPSCLHSLKIKIARLFGSEVAKFTPPPNKNCQGLWIWGYQIHLPSPRKWKLSGTLDLSAGNWCVESNHCILDGYRLVRYSYSLEEDSVHTYSFKHTQLCGYPLMTISR